MMGGSRRLTTGPRVAMTAGMLLLAGVMRGEAAMMEMNLRSRRTDTDDKRIVRTVYRSETWEPARTAVVICDVWDTHWCRGAAARVAELAPRVDAVAKALRARGCLVVHCPSGTMTHYANTPQRRLALDAPVVETGIPLRDWCARDEATEPPLPVADTDNGCDCPTPCTPGTPWTRQISTIEIAPGDAIGDGPEVFYLMKQRNIRNVLLMGVHVNKCILGRPFGIRQLVRQGMNVALVRDLTDSQFGPRDGVRINHFTGTDLVVEHIEQYLCATVGSDALGGGKPFRFAADSRKRLLMVMAEDEYETNRTLPVFAHRRLGDDFKVDYVFGDPKQRDRLPGIEQLDDADAVLISVRRWPLLARQMAALKRFVDRGGAVVGIRTASHAFALNGDKQPGPGLAVWPEFDHDVLGGHYTGHYRNKPDVGPPTVLWPATEELANPILSGLPEGGFNSPSWLYKTSPLGTNTTTLLVGRVADNVPEPAAWTNVSPGGGRVFYTSLGHPGDFALEPFRRLLLNALRWAAGIEPPKP